MFLQKRLFDDTVEGYKVLNYLETRNLGEIYGLTIVPLLHSALFKLQVTSISNSGFSLPFLIRFNYFLEHFCQLACVGTFCANR